jgi:arylsulfatase A-like enzyme
MRYFLASLPLAVLLMNVAVAAESESRFARKPNFLVILADDLGFSDLGCYGSEIATPNLDQLAKHGLRYTQFYNTARCWPTRAALLTGYYPQQIHRDALPTIPGGGGPKFARPVWAPLLPKLLKPAGYQCYYSGKWHIDGTPAEGGFDRSYELLDQGRFFRPKQHRKDGRSAPEVKDSDGYYSTVAIADYAVQQLKAHSESGTSDPFFEYVAFTAPHFPLQALPEDIARYADRYKDGWEKVRQARFNRMRAQELVSGSISKTERLLGPPYAFPEQVRLYGPNEVALPIPWDDLNDDQRSFQATKMAIHAAMVDRMDREIGRILDQLRTMNAFDDTLILFLSDNGASAEMMVRGDGHDPNAAPGWSTVSNTPFRRHKTWVHEGGISTPLIAHWPSGIMTPGELRRTVGHVIDVVPTIMDIAGVEQTPSGADDSIPIRPGRSLVASFLNDDPALHESLWWLHEGNRAIRSGRWKAVAAKDQPWELYDLETDRSEQSNMAESKPEMLSRLTGQWEATTEEFTQLNSPHAD